MRLCSFLADGAAAPAHTADVAGGAARPAVLSGPASWST